MVKKYWSNAGKKYLICVDSYEEGILKGRICDPPGVAESFSSLSQFLLKMEEILDEEQKPQAYTTPRRFSDFRQPQEPGVVYENCSGCRATFELKVVFRQNSSWQGVLSWRDTRQEENFRSVLEMVILMDSALRSGAA